MSLEQVLRGATALLDELGLPYCVAGGLAVAAYVPARFTVDVDLVVAVDSDAVAESAVRDFAARGYRLTEALEHEATGRLATVRLRSEAGVLDLILAATEVERELVDGAIRLQLLPDLAVPTACLGHLIALKLLSVDARRPRDDHDLVDLVAAAGPADIDAARALCARMAERGANRGRDLLAALDTRLARR